MLEMQLDRLHASAVRRGGVDCIVFGNSLAFFGFNPDVFSAVYAERTGRPIRCYDLGVLGMTAADVGPLARVLADEYHPWLLIYAASARDLTWMGDAPAIATMPWVRYRLGTFSLDGWLTDRLYVYRYYLAYRSGDHLMGRLETRAPTAVSPEGFLPSRLTMGAHAAPLALFEGMASRVFSHGIVRAQLDGFSAFLDLQGMGLQPVVVEMPIHPALTQRLATNPGYANTIARMRAETRRRHVLFLRKRSWRMIDERGWGDFSHLNAHGADILTRWLAGRIATAIERGDVHPPDRET